MRRLVFLAGLVVACSARSDGGGGGGGEPAVDAAAAVFNGDEFNDVHLTMAPADWQSILDDSRGNQRRQAAFRWKDENVPDVGVHPSSGPRAPGNLKQSMIVTFDAFAPGQRWRTLRQLKLDGLADDPSMIRDRLTYEVFRGVTAAARTAHCRLFVNGESRGVYELQEINDEVFAGRVYGAGYLYSMQNTTVDPYLWKDGDALTYVPDPWSPVRDGYDHTRVVRFIDVLNRAPAQLSDVCDLDTLITYFAADAAVTDVHGFTGDLIANNHEQHHRSATGRFHIIANDFAETWGNGDGVPTRGIFENFQRSKLSAIVENDPVLRARYKARIGEIIETVTHPARIAERVDFIYVQIRDAAQADPYKPWTTSHFDWSQGFIRDFAAARYDSLRTQIAQP